ncbi:hypothetical protein BaRGS_00028925 [Batillaria attramentaria]|uniref:Uncharacterized protein n=1 Tax=Batillaria attramentaria TaxID=370345 RepID=A0ABD0JZ52_9CAEN
MAPTPNRLQEEKKNPTHFSFPLFCTFLCYTPGTPFFPLLQSHQQRHRHYNTASSFDARTSRHDPGSHEGVCAAGVRRHNQSIPPSRHPAENHRQLSSLSDFGSKGRCVMNPKRTKKKKKRRLLLCLGLSGLIKSAAAEEGTWARLKASGQFLANLTNSDKKQCRGAMFQALRCTVPFSGANEN